MPSDFVKTTGSISITSGDDFFSGTGTTFAGHDWEGAQVWINPASGARYCIGVVAAVDPQGVYPNLGPIPLVSEWRGSTATDEEFEIIDGPAIANAARQSAIYARFTEHLKQNMGLVGNTADEDVDFSLVPANSLFVDGVSRVISQWRGGVLEPVQVIGAQFLPSGEWDQGGPRGTLTIGGGNVAVSLATYKKFILTFNANFTLQLPTNCEVGDEYTIVFVNSGGTHTRAFASGHVGEAASEIRTLEGERTVLLFTVGAETAGTATEVSVQKVVFDINDLVTDSESVWISNVDDNFLEPGTDNASWTAFPMNNISVSATGTSVTSLSLGTGSKVFTTQTGRIWALGTRLRAASAADLTTHWMEGVVTDYTGDQLTVSMDKFFGSGTRADWNIGIIGQFSAVAGADGSDPGAMYDYSTTVTAGASAGTFRFNNATWASVTALYVADLDRSNNDLSPFMLTVGDSTSVTKGHILLTDPATGAQAIFVITGAASDQSGYTSIPVDWVAGATSFTNGNAISLQFELRGDAGSGADDFLDLTDTPANYSGAASKIVRVNSGATALEFGPVLGDAAAKNTGTTNGTLAAGDDSRITGAIQSSVLTTRGDIIFRNATVPARLGKGTTGQILRQGTDDPAWADDFIVLEYVIDGGGAVITTGVKGDLVCEQAGTILGWTILADQSGSIVIDVWKDTYANYPPVVGDSITASAKPTVTTATKNQSSTLTGWTTSVTAGDIFRFNVDSVTSHTRVIISLKIRPS